ncbi:glycine N-acyltransferase-like protein 3 isoform X2 [Neoarius graeffei]|uniref:glycine N-acyltransferase-like protein 3 isoform X2 n=1 Tax=Neoarius graeffei TaxID=443677 RepID=UPI00298C85A1|nr:glycine N-acyltransferase-like protein 3 isoform X2 [Neoarius graeffei]
MGCHLSSCESRQKAVTGVKKRQELQLCIACFDFFQVYGYVCIINRIKADPIDVLVDQWPDFNVLLARPKWQQKSDIYKVICVFTKDETSLRNMLIGTDVLDWKQFFRLSTDVRHEEMLKAVAVMRGVPMSKLYVCHVLKLQDPSNLTMERLPLQVSSLNESHVALVNSTWKFGMGEFSEKIIRDMIMNFPSCCVLDSEGQPVSWILTYSCCAVGMLYTLPEHRRKGYAKALVTILAKKLHSEGCPVYCLIEEENQLSYRLFTNLGFTEDPSFRITGFKFNQLC